MNFRRYRASGVIAQEGNAEEDHADETRREGVFDAAI